MFSFDPSAGRVAVYDLPLSVIVAPDVPIFRLLLRAEAGLDTRNLLDLMTSVEDGESLLSVAAARRMVRGGISVRF